MNTFRQWLNDIWFPLLSPSRLAAIRILAGLFALWYIGSRYSMLLKIASADAGLFQPVGVVSWLSEPLPLMWFQGLIVFTLVANLAFVLGWQYRIAGPAFGLGLLVLLCYRNSWSMIYHSDNAMVLHILILGFSRAADVFSLDSYWTKSEDKPTLDDAHWRYGWPVQLISAVTLGAYFLSGVAKLAGESGLSWLLGESLRSQIAVDAIRKQLLGAPASDLAFLLYDQVWLFTILGAASLIAELGAPFALLHRRLGYGWAANTFIMHWGIFALMSITFRYQLTGLIFLSFLPLERLVDAFRRRKLPFPQEGKPAPIVIFDGHCRFCLAQMRLLQLVDLSGRLRFLSLHEEQVKELVPAFGHEDLMAQMVVRSPQGVAYAGAEAVRYLFRTLPLLWVGAPLLHLPGSTPFWDWAYRQIAQRRYLLAGSVCKDGTCTWQGAEETGVGHVK